ncbi:PqqD family protein [Patescibacteria group bacterium]|nr:PqqD family protein [Patescibacteria group bacterium]MCG2701637.1 PqqD family protein [Candidatus Parcubacteria bacterium]MBU4265523.1 PqqD family protein [Patescibacteria group bacterium]MBU4389851.1 PqqD family protein [Patescibacteria group bacterium]MBU4430890.1 PqqD family protein [Patescibacteria group bacterium]
MKKYIRNEDLVWEEVGGELVVLDYNKGKVYTLNDTAFEIWRILEKKASFKEIFAYLLLCHTGYNKSEMRSDLEEILNNFMKISLILEVKKNKK